MGDANEQILGKLIAQYKNNSKEKEFQIEDFDLSSDSLRTSLEGIQTKLSKKRLQSFENYICKHTTYPYLT